MYSATICRIKNVRKHPTADRMLLASACGFQVIVGLNTAENTLGIFFPSDGALSRMFAEKNDLIRRTENGVKCGGLFDDNCRVRAQKLRGQISEGFWCELSYLEKIDAKATAKLKEGDELTELNGIPICNKYITPATRHQINRQKKTPRKNPRFKEHVETAQFRKCVGSIPVGALIYISEKIHGCVDGNTIIDTLEYGKVPISFIVNNKLKCSIKCFNIKKQEIVWEPVADFYFYPQDTDWYEITLEDETTLIITGNNPVWCPKLNIYKRANELNIEDVLLVNT